MITERIRLTPGGAALVRTMKANGAYTMLVSGGFTLFTGPISAAIGFDAHRSNLLLIDSGRFAGTVAEPILGREAKLAALIELRTELGLAASETLAVGDGANDLAMLGEAGLGVAYHAKPQVAASRRMCASITATSPPCSICRAMRARNSWADAGAYPQERRHARACPGHPRLLSRIEQPWMAGKLRHCLGVSIDGDRRLCGMTSSAALSLLRH